MPTATPPPPATYSAAAMAAAGLYTPFTLPPSIFFTIRTNCVCIGVIDACMQVGGSPNGAFAFDGDCEFQVTREA
jgi:hypothetical protein